MTENQVSSRSERVYRVDKFVVPGRARDEFLMKL